jgi:multidrug efflux pump subunit AcrB
LKDIRQFEKILLRTNPDGSQLLLIDVARVELGSESFNSIAKNNGNPGVVMIIMLSSGANALDTAAMISEKLERLSAFFPPGMKYAYTFDTTPFVDASIHEVFKTLVIAVRLRSKKKVQNPRELWYEDVAQHHTTQGDFGLEPP